MNLTLGLPVGTKVSQKRRFLAWAAISATAHWPANRASGTVLLRMGYLRLNLRYTKRVQKVNIWCLPPPDAVCDRGALCAPMPARGPAGALREAADLDERHCFQPGAVTYRYVVVYLQNTQKSYVILVKFIFRSPEVNINDRGR